MTVVFDYVSPPRQEVIYIMHKLNVEWYYWLLETPSQAKTVLELAEGLSMGLAVRMGRGGYNFDSKGPCRAIMPLQ